MDTVFLLLLGISMLCIPIFIIWAIINLILRRSAKKRFAFAGISALVFVISIIGFALTSDDPAPDNSISVTNEAPVAAEEPAISEPVDIAAEQPQPAPEPTNASGDIPAAAPDKAASITEEIKDLQQEEEQTLAEERTVQGVENIPFTEENTQQYSEDEQAGAEIPQSYASDNSNNFNTYDNADQQQTSATYVLNTSSKKFHYPSCESVKKIAPQNYATSCSSRDELIVQNYKPCGNCNP